MYSLPSSEAKSPYQQFNLFKTILGILFSQILAIYLPQ
jgi:hypothetical protein